MDIYQHFRKEEQPFIDQVFSWKDQVERQYIRRTSDFLDPREQKIFQSIIGNDDQFLLKFFGGTTHTERKQAILSPYYESISQTDFPIAILSASYPTRFITIEHRDVLGTFLSLGLKRKKLGDIMVDQEQGKIQLIVSKDVADFVCFNLTAIKNASIQLERIPLQGAVDAEQDWKSYQTTISSLRLDVVIKHIYGLSRQQAGQVIQKGIVKVNFRIVEDPAFVVEEGDVFSLRGKGRSRLTELLGLSKKEKWKIIYEILN